MCRLVQDSCFQSLFAAMSLPVPPGAVEFVGEAVAKRPAAAKAVAKRRPRQNGSRWGRFNKEKKK